MARLGADPVLDLAPDWAELGRKYATLPCEDEDRRGAVGRPVLHQGPQAAIRDFYRTEIPKLGWAPRGEADSQAPGDGLDIGMPELCFEKPDFPEVSLEVHLDPTTDGPGTTPGMTAPSRNFVEFVVSPDTPNCPE